jgi:D-alanyl-D-alanine carboxypeptidase (penicillin-binding protein 5/6)
MDVTRRILILLAGLALSGLVACGGTAEPGTSPSPSSLPALPTFAPTAAAPPVKAWSGVLMERRTGKVLWSKDRLRELPPASCTKIMTALLTLEHVKDLRRFVTVPDIPYPQHVGVDLRPGDRIRVRQALTALMLHSANDAALTLAAHVAGSEPRFVDLMNERAAQLGLRHTHFSNCRGTDEPGHHSCARDLARLGRFAMRDDTFRELVSTRTAVVRYPPDAAVPVQNRNRLLGYPWADGIKTGGTDDGGMVLVGSGKPGATALIVVTMHEPSRRQEVLDALALFAWGSRSDPPPASPAASPAGP